MLGPVLLAAVARASPGCPWKTLPCWERLGPSNIFDDAMNRGESGTLADAASPASNPNVPWVAALAMASRVDG